MADKPSLGRMMSDLIRSQAHGQQPTKQQQASAQVHNLYKQGLRNIRGNRNMHPDRKRVEIAELYATTRAALDKLRTEQTQQDQTDMAKLERKMWGYDDVRTTAIDKAAVDHTIRDAQDRAAKLTKPEQAARALAEAEQAGDHILARAIGKRAHDQDWGDVLHDYLATRPRTADDYQQAGAIWHRNNSTQARMQHHMQYVVHKPDELRGVSDSDIEAMADPQESAA